jgi:hypothetical protein
MKIKIMTITFKIDENDYLTHQLFVASKSDRIKKKRQKSKIIIPIFYFGFALLFLFQDRYLLTIIFIVISILWFFIYPIWERQYYVKHYKGFIEENYKSKLDNICTIEISNDLILVKAEGSESKIQTTLIEEICEIPKMVLIRLNGGQSFILPKDKIANFDTLIGRLKELANHLKIEYINDYNWKWM